MEIEYVEDGTLLLREWSGRTLRRATFRQHFLRFFVSIAGLPVAVLLVSCGGRQTPDAGPMLQEVGTNTVTVVWFHSRAETAALTLRDPSGQLRRVPAQHVGTRFEARIDGLQPSTAYAYWVECGAQDRDNPQTPGRFHTAPLPGAPLSFLVFGDSGSGKASQHRLAEVMNRHPADFVLHTGDLVYRRDQRRDYLKQFFHPYKSLLASTPFYPVLGNHDLRADHGRLFMDTFKLPTNGPPGVQAERCYWFDYGNGRFVAVDSNLSTQALVNAVSPWLRQVLQSSPLQWKVVFFHHPPWAGGHRPPDAKIRDLLVPAIEAGRADVVFCGHNHLYERTHPLHAGRISPTNGVLYITSGAGGRSLHQEKHATDPHIAAFNDTKFSFTLIEMDGPTLVLVQISENDMILDKLIVKKASNAGVDRE